jgi:hypothetical protein
MAPPVFDDDRSIQTGQGFGTGAFDTPRSPRLHFSSMRSILGGFLAFFWLVAVAGAQVTGVIESIGFGGDYRPGCWTPLVVRLQSTGAPTDFYEVRVWQNDLDGDLPYYSTRVSLTAGADPQPFWTYFVPEPVREGLTPENSQQSDLARRLRVTLHDKAGRELIQIPLGPSATARSIDGLLGGFDKRRATRFALFVGTAVYPPLDQYDRERITGIKEDLAVARFTPDRLPENVLGYDGIDVIVWLEGDPAALSAGNSMRFEALRSFVRRGGHLVLCTPPQWQQLNGFGDLLPVNLTGVETNSQQSPARDIAGRVPYPTEVRQSRQDPWETFRTAFTIGVATPREGSVVDRVADRVANPRGPQDETPWLVRMPYGYGAVTWVAQDMGHRDLVDRANWGWPAVWEEILGSPANVVVDPTPRERSRWDGVGEVEAGYVALEAIQLGTRGAKLVGITVGFFIAYWLLAGPGVFFWLRYKQQTSRNWFVFGLMAIAATLLTLGVVRLVLRGSPEVKHLSLVRVDNVRSPAWVESRLSMYVPRDGAQRLEVGASSADAVAASTILPLPIHPSIHRAENGDRYLFPAPRTYRVPVPSADSTEPAVSDVPFRTTSKRLKATWSGPLDARIDGSARLTASQANTGFIAGTLNNLTGKDLRNVYIAFRHQLPGGTPSIYLMHVPGWSNGATLDLAAAFNPPADKSTQDITVGGEKNIRPNNAFPVRGRLNDWMELFGPALQRSALTGTGRLPDLSAYNTETLPLLSFYNALLPVQNVQNADGSYSRTLSHLHRNGLRQWDVSPALEAGRLVVVAQAQDTTLPLPLSVEGARIDGTGMTVYQFILPLTPVPAPPTSQPSTQPTP